MNKIDIKQTVENLIDTFLYAGKVSLELREKGLIKKIKSDNTPVSNGDLEVNKIITEKILSRPPLLFKIDPFSGRGILQSQKIFKKFYFQNSI